MPGNCWDLYECSPSFVLGFHGCDEGIGERVLAGKLAHLSPSTNKYDWLGSGIYFWEGNPQRAFDWALERASRSRKATAPFVLGAVLDMGHCLDLMDASGLGQVKDAHAILEEACAVSGRPLPMNHGPERGARVLDCLVINSLHDFRRSAGERPFDTIRAVFPEGDDLYANAGFRDKNHIQICVRNLACIKGYFRPIRKGVPRCRAAGGCH